MRATEKGEGHQRPRPARRAHASPFSNLPSFNLSLLRRCARRSGRRIEQEIAEQADFRQFPPETLLFPRRLPFSRVDEANGNREDLSQNTEWAESRSLVQSLAGGSSARESVEVPLGALVVSAPDWAASKRSR